MRQVCIVLSAVVATQAAHAQECLWNYHAEPTSTSGEFKAVYHSGLDRVLLVTPREGNLPTVRIWARDGGSWSLLDSAGPPARREAAATYDAGRARVVLFGGHYGIYVPQHLGETWEWNGAAWSLASSTGPAPRSGHSMAYDAARQRTVLFGGESAGGLLGDTWEWDGLTWTLASQVGPAPRRSSVMAYDSSRGKVLLYGGYGDGVLREDLWEWDGTWSQRTGAQPGSRALWLAFDSARARAFLGRMAEGAVKQTWELEPMSGQWTLRDPGRASLGSGAFHPASATIVFAGEELHPAAVAISPYSVQPLNGAGVYVGETIILQANIDGTAPLSFRWERGGDPIVDGGRISGATTPTLTITDAELGDGGHYVILTTNACGTHADWATVLVYEHPTGCYANCDESTAPPVLNVADFTCFLQRYAAGETYANCDHGYSPPILNVADFTCFLQRYAAGCP